MVDRIELTEIMSRALGRPIRARKPVFEEWAQKAQIPMGADREGLQTVWLPGGNPILLRTILDREPRTLSSFFAELAAGCGQAQSAA
jgi:hypothetical protein